MKIVCLFSLDEKRLNLFKTLTNDLLFYTGYWYVDQSLAGNLYPRRAI